MIPNADKIGAKADRPCQPKNYAMIIRIPVGDAEKHEVTFEFRQHTDYLSITIDGEPAIKDWGVLPGLPLRSVNKKGGLVRDYCRPFRGPFSRIVHYRFVVGREELHKVVVQREIPTWFGGLRIQRYRVYVDNEFVEEYEG